MTSPAASGSKTTTSCSTRTISDARGIWSGDGIMWVLDSRADALFAYDLGSGDLLGEYALHSANGDPHGLWSDGVTIWVSDHGEKDLLAYRLPMIEAEGAPVKADLERVRDEDFTELSEGEQQQPARHLVRRRRDVRRR